MPDKTRYKNLRAAAWLTQFGLSMVSPLILCIIAALWLKNKFGLGNWVMITAIILGAGSCAASMVSFIKTVKRELGGKTDDEKNSD